jgi:hypothetical protein
MDNDEIIDSFELKIRFDQHPDDRISWQIIPDEVLKTADHMGLIQLAECGAPLAAMALLVLWHHCSSGLITSSIDLADAVRNETLLKLGQQLESDLSTDLEQDISNDLIVH